MVTSRVKLKRVQPGKWRIGNTNWWLLHVYDDHGRHNGLWDIGYFDPAPNGGFSVGEMFTSRKKAIEYFVSCDFWPDWGPRRE